MPEETEKVEMTEVKAETPPAEPKAETKVDTPAKASDSETQAELEKTREALKKANKESAERRKRLEELEAKEKERELAAMSETEKLQARLKELETQAAEKDQLLKTKERQDLQYKVAKTVAKELGLSIETAEGLADRLKGETEDEITEDAKIVFALLPKQQEAKKPTPKIDPTNPGDAVKGETRAQIRERTLGGNKSVWGSGTVTMVEKE